MSRGQKRPQVQLNELIDFAQGLEIEVRTERLLREVGYRALSGSCRVRGKRLIILDRDLPVREQVDLLADELRRSVSDATALPRHLTRLLSAGMKDDG